MPEAVAGPRNADRIPTPVCGARQAEVPILQSQQTIGLLTLTRNRTRPFSAEDARLAEVLAWQASKVLEHTEELKRWQRLSRGLGELEGLLAYRQGKPKGRTEQEVIRVARIALGFDGSALYLRDPAGAAERLVASDGRTPKDLPSEISPADGLDLSGDGAEIPPAMSVPLRWGSRLQGTLILYARANAPVPAVDRSLDRAAAEWLSRWARAS
jgi:hypothetical protein